MFSEIFPSDCDSIIPVDKASTSLRKDWAADWFEFSNICEK
jgi:hypothetical protein